MKTIAIGVGENENIIQACHIFKEKHPKTDIRLIYSDEDLVKAVLNDTYINFEDIMISYGKSNEVDRKQYFLTQFKCVDRFFRIRELERANEEMLREEEKRNKE